MTNRKRTNTDCGEIALGVLLFLLIVSIAVACHARVSMGVMP